MPFFPQVDLTSVKRLFGSQEDRTQFVVSEFISPTLDIATLGLMHAREFVFDNQNAAAAGVFGSFVVPDRQFWLIHLVSAASDVLDADQAATFQVAMRAPGGSAILTSPITRLGSIESVPASSVGGVGIQFNPGMLLPPNGEFGVVINTATLGAAGAIAFSVQAQITRIRL